jgi:peptidoglycan-associated lipoprotein
MRTRNLAYLGLAVLLSTAACHHAVPVAASHPPDTTPVPPPSSSTPATPRSSGTPAPPPSQPVAQTPRASTPLPPEVRATLNEKLARLEDAMFDYDKATIRTDASTALKDDVGVIRDILANYPAQKLLIEGHCDERGSEEYNMALGDRRAKATQEFLSSMGIPDAQLTVISFGKDRPVCTANDEECYQKNRRAHMSAAP